MVPGQQSQKICGYCGRAISWSANQCPHCGYGCGFYQQPPPVTSLRFGLTYYGFILAVVGTVAGFAMIICGVLMLVGDIDIDGATAKTILELSYLLAFSGTVIATVSANVLVLSRVFY